MTIAYLHVVEGPGAGGVHPVAGEATIGRGRTADIVLLGPSISRDHAAVRVEGLTAVIEDLGSSNGTWVNGEPIHSAVRVGDGDVIQIGEVALQVSIETGEAGDVSTPTEPTVLQERPSGN